MSSHSRALADLLAAAETRKIDGFRRKLGLAASVSLSLIQLESLAYHLTERTGRVHVAKVGDRLLVGDPESSGRISYHGEAIPILLKAWSITHAEAAAGITFDVTAGQRS